MAPIHCVPTEWVCGGPGKARAAAPRLLLFRLALLNSPRLPERRRKMLVWKQRQHQELEQSRCCPDYFGICPPGGDPLNPCPRSHRKPPGKAEN